MIRGWLEVWVVAVKSCMIVLCIVDAEVLTLIVIYRLKLVL